MVIIEGPDGSGKTTLLKQLGLERRTFKSMHGGVGGTTPNGWAPGSDPYDALVEILLNKQYEETQSNIKIGIDRLHLSEWVYGPLLRNKQLITDEVLTNFSRLLRRHHIPVIPLPTTIRHHSEERSAGRPRATDVPDRRVPACGAPGIHQHRALGDARFRLHNRRPIRAILGRIHRINSNPTKE
jgi:predicted ATPase